MDGQSTFECMLWYKVQICLILKDGRYTRPQTARINQIESEKHFYDTVQNMMNQENNYLSHLMFHY